MVRTLFKTADIGVGTTAMEFCSGELTFNSESKKELKFIAGEGVTINKRKQGIKGGFLLKAGQGD